MLPAQSRPVHGVDARLHLRAGERGEIYVNLYLSSAASFPIEGQSLHLAVESEMPWGGRSTIKVSAKEALKGTIKLRVPGWARNRPVPGGLYSYLDKTARPTRLSVNGRTVTAAVDASGYVSLDRNWADGDLIEIEFPFDVKRVVADNRVKQDRGRIAVERGPIVFCAEWPDCDERRVLRLVFDPSVEWKPSFDKDFYGGATVLHGEAREIGNASPQPEPLKLIPYHLWANRGPGEMTVWLPTRDYAPGDIGPAGGLIFYVNPNYATDGWRYLEAAPVDQSAGAKWGCFRTPIAGARGTAVGSGRQNTADIIAACTGLRNRRRIVRELPG